MLSQFKQFHNRDVAFLGYLAGVKLLLHLFTNRQYSYFVDELYYISGHTEYYYWESREYSGKLALSMSDNLSFQAPRFDSVEQVATIARKRQLALKVTYLSLSRYQETLKRKLV